MRRSLLSSKKRFMSGDREVTILSETESAVDITESMCSFAGQSTMGLRRPRGDSGDKYDRSTEYTYRIEDNHDGITEFTHSFAHTTVFVNAECTSHIVEGTLSRNEALFIVILSVKNKPQNCLV